MRVARKRSDLEVIGVYLDLMLRSIYHKVVRETTACKPGKDVKVSNHAHLMTRLN